MFPAIKHVFAVGMVTAMLLAGDVADKSRAASASPSGDTPVVAQTNPVDWAQGFMGMLIEKLGPLAILAWYLYRHETKTLPDKDKQIADAQSQYQADLKIAREIWTKEMADARASHEKTVSSLVAQIQKHADMVLSIVQKCPGLKDPG